MTSVSALFCISFMTICLLINIGYPFAESKVNLCPFSYIFYKSSSSLNLVSDLAMFCNKFDISYITALLLPFLDRSVTNFVFFSVLSLSNTRSSTSFFTRNIAILFDSKGSSKILVFLGSCNGICS